MCFSTFYPFVYVSFDHGLTIHLFIYSFIQNTFIEHQLYCVLDTVWTLTAMWRVVWARERMDQAEGHRDTRDTGTPGTQRHQAERCWVIREAQGEVKGTA